MSEIKTSVKSITDTISVCLKNNLTFASYRLPGKNRQTLLVQRDKEAEEVYDLAKITSYKGFLVAPYMKSAEKKMFVIKPDFLLEEEVSEEDYYRISEVSYEENKPKPNAETKAVLKDEYLKQIEEIISAIKEGELHKAVLSRVKIVAGNYLSRIPEIFEKLCELFPNAFVYVFRTLDHFWMGATPEPFAFLRNSNFQTSSVAGTKENTEKYHWIGNWGTKEKQEQQYVTDHIDRVLKSTKLDIINHNGPYVKEAGNLLHLQTDFTTSASAINGNIGELLSNLHPTPAICGYPSKEALELLKKIEKHDRGYYAGFLGPVGIINQLMLFVNLRCMQIFENMLFLYSGGGITIDSNPVDEWYETEIKTGTLLSAIETVS